MKFTLVSLLAFFIIINANNSYGKNKNLMKAKYLYQHNSFHDAIPFFEKVADEENNPEIFGELGDCYRFTSNLKNAEIWYSKAVNLQGCKDIIIMRYARVLMEMMKYVEAKKYLLDYQTRNKDERRVANLIASCTSAPEILAGKPKGEISFLNINTNGSEYAPSFWKNNLVFTADIALNKDKSKNKIVHFTFNEIYFVPCDKEGNCTKEVKRISVRGISDKEHMGPATFSPDGKKMYFTTTKASDITSGRVPTTREILSLPLEIMVAADFDTMSNEFKNWQPFKYNSKKFSMSHPTVSPDGKTIIFSSDRPGGEGGSDLYMSGKDEDGEWSKPVNLGSQINTEGEEVFPYLADNNTLFFASDGLEGLGGLDIYMAKWDESKAAFSKPVNLGTPINSSYDDMSLAMYPDLRSSYFSSDRPAIKGGDNIYYYNRTHSYLHIKLFDDVTNNPLNVANVVLESGGNKRYVTVDKFGEFIAPVYPDLQYKLSIGKNGYVAKNITVSSAGFKENDTVIQTVELTSVSVAKEREEAKKREAEQALVVNQPPVKVRDSSYYKKPSFLFMTIIDSSTKKPIKKATVSLESDRDTRDITANDKGKLFTQLIPEIQYAIRVSKTGYNPKVITLITIFGHDEPDTFSEKVALSVAKIVKGKKPKVIPEKHKKDKKDKKAEENKDDVTKTAKSNGTKSKNRLCSLNGYYAEYNKAEIVEEKKYILDSLVLMLTENPTMRIRIFGHADCRGSAEYNMKLSTERAIAVGKYLVSKGIDPRRLEHKGLGVTKPVVKCPVCNECAEDQHEKNRGFEYTVLHK